MGWIVGAYHQERFVTQVIGAIGALDRAGPVPWNLVLVLAMLLLALGLLRGWAGASLSAFAAVWLLFVWWIG